MHNFIGLEIEWVRFCQYAKFRKFALNFLRPYICSIHTDRCLSKWEAVATIFKDTLYHLGPKLTLSHAYETFDFAASS